MKSYKKVMPILLLIALIGSLAFTLNNRAEKHDSYQAAIAQAREFAEKGLVKDALASYEEALSIDPTLDTYLEVGQYYLDREDYNGGEAWFHRLTSAFPREAASYEYGIKLYLLRNDYNRAYETYDTYKARRLQSEAVEALIEPIRYRYVLAGGFQDVAVFSGSPKTAPVFNGEKWGFVETDLDEILKYRYIEAEPFSGSYAAVVDKDGNASYIDTEGSVKINEAVILATDPEFGKVVRFQGIQAGHILAFNGKIWNYYNSETYAKQFGGFMEATPIGNGVGAVSLNGKDWALIGNDGSLITDYKYGEILRDPRNIIARADSLIVKEGNKYYLIDKQGSRIGSTGYEKACAFYDDTYAAVYDGKQWSFVDATGRAAIVGKFEDARSFSFNLAAVKVNGKWGYIDEKGKLAIPCEFLEAGPFSTDGVAFVKVDENTWRLLKLYRYNHG